MVDDNFGENKIVVHGSREFLVDVPGSSSACGWQMVEADIALDYLPRGNFWVRFPGDSLESEASLDLYGDDSSDRDQSIAALEAIINQARKAKNYLKRLKLADEQSS